MNAPIRDAFDYSSRKPMRRHFVLGFPRALLSLSQEKSSGVEIGNSLVLHCASLLCTIFASLARSHEHVRIQNVRDFAQTKLDREINAPFLSNEHGDPRFFFQVFARNSLIKNIFEEEKKFDSRT